MHGPALVTEVTLELSQHDRDGVLREGRASIRLEAIHCLQQPAAGHLYEVLERLAGVPIAAGKLACQGDEAHDELLAGGDITDLAVPLEQPLVLEPAIRRRLHRFECDRSLLDG